MSKRVAFKPSDESSRLIVGTAAMARDALAEREHCDECGEWDWPNLKRWTTDEGDHLLMQVLCERCNPDIPVQ